MSIGIAADMGPAEARSFALAAHGAQRYGSQPYHVHLDAVAHLVAPYGPLAQVVAYLHDLMEDTHVTAADIEARFGLVPSLCVVLLTDPNTGTRRERKAITYARLAGVVGFLELALIVKVGDRLANVMACASDAKRSLWEMYRAEHAEFRKAVFRKGLCNPLWVQLDALLLAWPHAA